MTLSLSLSLSRSLSLSPVCGRASCFSAGVILLWSGGVFGIGRRGTTHNHFSKEGMPNIDWRLLSLLALDSWWRENTLKRFVWKSVKIGISVYYRRKVLKKPKKLTSPKRFLNLRLHYQILIYKNESKVLQYFGTCKFMTRMSRDPSISSCRCLYRSALTRYFNHRSLMHQGGLQWCNCLHCRFRVISASYRLRQ